MKKKINFEKIGSRSSKYCAILECLSACIHRIKCSWQLNVPSGIVKNKIYIENYHFLYKQIPTFHVRVKGKLPFWN